MKISWHCAAWIVLASLAQCPIALAHWPGQPQHQMAYLGDLQLEDGGVIKNLKMSCVTHGKLNATKRALRAILKAADN